MRQSDSAPVILGGVAVRVAPNSTSVPATKAFRKYSRDDDDMSRSAGQPR